MAALTGVVVIALMGSACSETADGSPTPQPGASRPASTAPSEEEPSEDPTDGAPRVEHPLDATRFLANPCAVLSQAQLATLDVPNPGIPTTTGAVAEQAGPFCTWTAATDLGSTISVGFVTGNEVGLSDNYRARDDFAYFEPTTVDDYPAVFTERSDLRARGLCNIVVGISDTLTFRAAEDGRLDAQGSCDRAKQVAAAALATIREGG